MTEEIAPQVLLTATGFAAREAPATMRKHKIVAAPLLLRAGLSEYGLSRAADKGSGLPLRVSAIGQCKFLEYAAEAMDDSVFGLHLAGQIDPRDAGMYFCAGSAARDLREALALFSRYCRRPKDLPEGGKGGMLMALATLAQLYMAALCQGGLLPHQSLHTQSISSRISP